MENSSTFNFTALDFIDRGVARASENDFEGARSDFEAAVKLAPESVDAFSNLGSALQALNLHREAIEIYSQGLAIQPNHSISFYCRAVSFSYLGEWEASQNDYTKAISLNPDFARAFMGRGYVFKRIGENELAMADFEKFMTLAGVDDAPLANQVAEWQNEIEEITKGSQNQSLDDLFDETYRYVQNGNGMAAIAIYSEILSQDPKSVEALANRANVYAVTQDYRLALIDIRQAIELDDTIPILFFNRANIYMDLGEIELAKADYLHVIEKDPEHPGSLLQIGKIKEKEVFGSGQAEINKAIELDPWFADALIERARFRNQKGEYSLAMNDLITAVDLDPQNPEIYELTNFVIEHFNKRVGDNPSDPFAFVARGQIFQRMGRYQDALADWNMAVRLAPENPLLIHARGNLYLETEQYQHAQMDFDRAIELDPLNMDFFLDRASALIALGRPDEAMQDIDHAIKMDSSKSDYYLFRGNLHRIRAQYEEAIEDLTLSIEKGETRSTVFYERAMAYLGTGNLEGAAADFEEVLLREESAEIHHDCGLTYIHLGYYDEALEHFSQAIEMAPEYADALTERGWILTHQGHYKAAFADLSEAIHLQPDAMWAWAYRAELQYPIRRLGKYNYGCCESFN